MIKQSQQCNSVLAKQKGLRMNLMYVAGVSVYLFEDEKLVPIA